MGRGARTPEELESLLEDAFVLRDRPALARLFSDGAVLGALEQGLSAGSEAIERVAARLWESGCVYVADPRHILQARDTALVLSDSGINVVRRGTDGMWRYAIAVLSFADHGLNGRSPNDNERASDNTGSAGVSGALDADDPRHAGDRDRAGGRAAQRL